VLTWRPRLVELARTKLTTVIISTHPGRFLRQNAASSNQIRTCENAVPSIEHEVEVDERDQVGDDEVRREVESLLAYRTKAEAFIEEPAVRDGLIRDVSDASKDHEWFSDGLSEEIINALTHVPGLKVTARTSAFAFKGQEQDITRIAKALRVRTILEGSVKMGRGPRPSDVPGTAAGLAIYHLMCLEIDEALACLEQAVAQRDAQAMLPVCSAASAHRAPVGRLSLKR
jgi:hypothetical protein